MFDLLFRMRYVRYLMAMWYMFSMDGFMEGMRMCRISSSSRPLSWMAPLTLVVVLFNGLTIHAWARIASISGLYLFVLVWMAWLMYMSHVVGEFFDLYVKVGCGGQWSCLFKMSHFYVYNMRFEFG